MCVSAARVICVDGYPGYPVLKLRDPCAVDIECQQADPNSQCSPSHEHGYLKMSKCACKVNYLVIVINNTERCVLVEPDDEEKEGLTAAPIILCFMGCVMVEAFCLLAFRYWKKRRSEFRRHGSALYWEAYPLRETRIPHNFSSGPIISVMISPRVETTISDIRASSPPPYNQTETTPSAQSEEPPPSYDEAMKQRAGATAAASAPSHVPSQKHKWRKMSF